MYVHLCILHAHLQTPINMSLIKEQTGRNIGEVCINSLGWYDANTVKNIILLIMITITIKAYYEISEEGYYTIGTVERLDGANMYMQMSFEASDGSQVFDGERKEVSE